MRPDEIVKRARASLGAPFRPQGRDVRIGLDCVGLVLSAYRITGTPPDYRLSGEGLGALMKGRLAADFRQIDADRRKPGDLLLMRVTQRQWHLGIWIGNGMIHADARRRAVVEWRGEPEWPIDTAFRRRRAAKG